MDTSLGGRRVVGVLDRLADTRGLPEVITIDNGQEFAGRALDEWAYCKGVKLNFIRPGKPIENAYAESFNGRFRDECLNTNWFLSLKHARDVIEERRRDYNEVRPHGSLDNLTPKQYVEQCLENQNSLVMAGTVLGEGQNSLAGAVSHIPMRFPQASIVLLEQPRREPPHRLQPVHHLVNDEY